jgi:hypothetical protein
MTDILSLLEQRNMLAIKFYNLQALIHRPLLSPTGLPASSPQHAAFYEVENIHISSSKIKCILAAQKTAKLLHDIEDKQSLVYGFPWWQMISCLICASSILLVASICVDPNLDRDVFKSTDWEAVDEDAEVCLKVFQALSSNSDAARLANDMMQRLKKTRKISQGEFLDSAHSATVPNISLVMMCYIFAWRAGFRLFRMPYQLCVTLSSSGTA